MSNYPPGAANDPRAPYNQEDPKMEDCPICGGDGYDPGGFNEDDSCERCKGTGQIEVDDE